MLRLLPLLVLALLPAAFGAPVPPDTRPDFGTNGLLSRADLEKVVFDTRAIKRADGREWPEETEPEERKGEEKRDEALPQRANRYDVAVHLPWAKFRAGEPMPVYCVLRNNRGAVLGFRSRIDLSGDRPEGQGSGLSFDIRDRATGASVLGGMSASTNCGGGSLVDVPAFGFYCVKGDLNRLTGAPLPPGEYEVDWSCGKLAAALVRFSVAPGDTKPKPVARRSHITFLHLQPGSDDDRLPERAGEPIQWREGNLNSVYTGSMLSALAVGPGGAYVPDARTIPTADKMVEAWAVWKPYRDGDRVMVTLRAVPPYEKVCFNEVPQLFLQVETPEENRNGRGWHEALAKRGDFDRGTLVTPLTIEARLPEGWREWFGESETARVAVLVASKQIEFPRGNAQVVEKLLERVDRLPNRERPSVWSGVVRSEFTELRLSLPKQ